MRGWFRQGYRHSLAAKGIRTSFQPVEQQLNDPFMAEKRDEAMRKLKEAIEQVNEWRELASKKPIIIKAKDTVESAYHDWYLQKDEVEGEVSYISNGNFDGSNPEGSFKRIPEKLLPILLLKAYPVIDDVEEYDPREKYDFQEEEDDTYE